MPRPHPNSRQPYHRKALDSLVQSRTRKSQHFTHPCNGELSDIQKKAASLLSCFPFPHFLPRRQTRFSAFCANHTALCLSCCLYLIRFSSHHFSSFFSLSQLFSCRAPLSSPNGRFYQILDFDIGISSPFFTFQDKSTR